MEFGLAPEQDPFWLDSAIMVSQARGANLNVGIFPIPQFAIKLRMIFGQRRRAMQAWWQTWFDHYRAFAVNYADLAAQTGSQALILGGDWLGPGPSGRDTGRWHALGRPCGCRRALELPSSLKCASTSAEKSGGRCHIHPANCKPPLNFLQATDGIYLLWNAPLATQAGASKTDMANQAGQIYWIMKSRRWRPW